MCACLLCALSLHCWLQNCRKRGGGVVHMNRRLPQNWRNPQFPTPEPFILLMTAKFWGQECKHLESSLLTAQAWRNEWLSRVQLQAPLWLVFKTIKLSGSRTIATQLEPRVGQLHMRNLTQSTIFPDFQTERLQTAGEGERRLWVCFREGSCKTSPRH